jgi:competence protein ComGC
MQKTMKAVFFGSEGFGPIDFLIIGAVVSILIFIIISNIIAHAY